MTRAYAYIATALALAIIVNIVACTIARAEPDTAEPALAPAPVAAKAPPHTRPHRHHHRASPRIAHHHRAHHRRDSTAGIFAQAQARLDEQAPEPDEFVPTPIRTISITQPSPADRGYGWLVVLLACIVFAMARAHVAKNERCML